MFFSWYYEGFSAIAKIDPDLCKRALGFLEAAAEHREDHDRAVVCRDGKGDLKETKRHEGETKPETFNSDMS